MLIKYNIRNNFIFGSKFIQLPIGNEFNTTGDDLRDFVFSERQKALKESLESSIDLETVRYTYPDNTVNNGKGLLVEFRFWDTTGLTYSSNYTAADFVTDDLKLNKNAFKKSFFRLYFYDTNTGETNNLIFTEDINLYGTTNAILPFNRLYWLRNDKDFISSNNDKTVYMDARFFNAKTGKIKRFINSSPFGVPPTVPLTITEYSDINNRDWRTSAIKIMNPKNNNGMYNFMPIVPFGANQTTKITLSEFVMQ